VRRLLSALIVALAVAGVLSARSGAQPPASPDAAPTPAPKDTLLVDLTADEVYPYEVGDSTVMCLVGNFAAHHNGAVITCDSAVRYNDMLIECFGHVLINKNTIYVYGDRADYNGLQNEARVYSELVKVVDGDATLYTRRFLFNTLDNVGKFGNGGVVVKGENLLESDRGYYYANRREVACVERVEMRNATYQLKGDSVIYDLQTDHAYFFDNTNIWNQQGDYLYADRGEYEKPDELYSLTRNGYVLTDKQELWSDSLDYYRATGHLVLRRNIQIDDTEHKSLAFGDYGEYWKEPVRALLTRRPAVVSYDPQQGDSLFMRADTIWVLTVFPFADADTLRSDSLPTQADSAGLRSPSRIPGARPSAGDSLGHDELSARGADSLARPARENASAQTAPVDAESASAASEPASVADSTVLSRTDEPAEELTPEQQRARLKEQALKEREEARAKKAAERRERLAKIGRERREKMAARAKAQNEREQARLMQRREKARARLLARQERLARKAERRGKTYVPADSVELHRLDSLIRLGTQLPDSLPTPADTTAVGAPVAADSLRAADSIPPALTAADSMYRMVKAYRDVRMFRSDFQAVCDSLVAFSSDSTIHLYIDPVLWNETNQVTSDVMDVFTEHEQIERVEFVGHPMMITELDTMYYNQVTGKEMTAFFRNNQIFRNDVNGNVQTIYYLQEDDSPRVVNLLVVEGGSMTSYIEQRKVDKIVYRANPVATIYPLDKIPEDQNLFLKDFKWEAERRPTQRDVFDRRIRPSLRDQKTALRKPEFPIFERIEDERRRLIEGGRWSDRNEPVAPEVLEWMHSLGY
jgi:hypothetical protein